MQVVQDIHYPNRLYLTISYNTNILPVMYKVVTYSFLRQYCSNIVTYNFLRRFCSNILFKILIILFV